MNVPFKQNKYFCSSEYPLNVNAYEPGGAIIGIVKDISNVDIVLSTGQVVPWICIVTTIRLGSESPQRVVFLDNTEAYWVLY